jgi:hypothetical protein
MAKLKTEVEIDLIDLYFELAMSPDIDHDDLFEFIKDLDEQVANWEFTERLAEYFQAEVEKLKDERQSDFESKRIRLPNID